MRSLLVAGILMLTTTPAFANSQADVPTCRVAVTAEAEDKFDDPSVTFKSMKGASLKTITFDVKSQTEKTTAVCKIKRGKIRSIDW